jgi:uncharacterized membrane protein
VPATLFYFLIGFATGLRSLTPLAVICWAAHAGWLQFAPSTLAFVGKWPTVTIFTLLAAAELLADKLPQTPPRTKAVGLTARMILGCVCGVLISVACSGHMALAVVAGFLGAIIGTFAGYHARHLLALRAHLPDFVVALTEDVIAIAGSLLIISLSR